MRAILLAAVLIGAPPATAVAESLARYWAMCREDDSPRLISSCTAVIRSGHETPENLARAFFNRGRAWTGKGEYDRAIQDFDQAVRLDPEYADAFNNRGVAYSGQGQFDRAIQDFDAAIRLDANYAIAIYNRGLALRNLGREPEAARDFARAKGVGPRLLPPKE
jgi:lipoprotein NlpI